MSTVGWTGMTQWLLDNSWSDLTVGLVEGSCRLFVRSSVWWSEGTMLSGGCCWCRFSLGRELFESTGCCSAWEVLVGNSGFVSLRSGGLPRLEEIPSHIVLRLVQISSYHPPSLVLWSFDFQDKLSGLRLIDWNFEPDHPLDVSKNAKFPNKKLF